MMRTSKLGTVVAIAVVGMSACLVGCVPPPRGKASGSASSAAPRPQPTAASATKPLAADNIANRPAANSATDAAPSAPAATPRVAPQADWPPLEPENEGFRIELPGRPELQTGEVETPQGTVHLRLYALADDEKNRSYNIAASRLPKKPPASEADGVLDRARDGAVKLSGGKLTSEQRVKHDRYSGRAAVVDLGGGMFVHLRTVLADDRLYQVSIVSNSDALTSEDRRVFDSLRIGEAKWSDPQPSWRWRHVTPAGATFAVEMPDDPQENIGVLNTPFGKVELRRLECRAGRSVYFAQSCVLPMSDQVTTTARLDAARDHLLAETGGKLIEERTEDFAGCSGRMLTLAVGDRRFLAHTLVDATQVFQIGVVGPRTGPSDAARRFFASFKIFERATAKP